MSKKGKENLVPIQSRSTDEQRKIQSMGGVASGEARRKRRQLKEYAEMLLALPVSNRNMKTQLNTLGVPEGEQDNALAAVMALVKKAQSGDVSAFRELRNLIGEDLRFAPGENEDDGLFAALQASIKQSQGMDDEV